MTTKEMTTRMKKAHDGWQAKTLVKDVKGFDWEIMTFKGYSKDVICIAQSGKHKDEGGYSSFSFTMFQDPRFTLAQEKIRATEKSIALVHEKGLQEFINKVNNQ